MIHTLLLGCCSSPHIHSLNPREKLKSSNSHITSLGPPSIIFSSRSSWTQSGRSFDHSVVVVQCNSTSSSHRLVEQTRRQIFEDGYAVFPRMWRKADDAMVIAQEQQKVLESFLLVDPMIDFDQEFVNVPAGHRCTDGATSPEPYWHHSWQIAGMEGEELQRPSWSATLVVSLSDRIANTFCGGIAVFPRSHWIMNDSIANSTSFPQPCDVPAAAPMELRLERGDMALLHPLLAYTIAPNVSSSPIEFLVFKLAKSRLKLYYEVRRWNCFQKCRGDEMWSGWRSMAMDQATSVDDEEMKAEEEKAQLGGWHDTMTGFSMDQVSLSTNLSRRVAPRDLLAWRLRNSALQFMQDGQWSNALSMLLRRAGLRPTCYWTTLQAGRCCMKSAPAGQLGGRAGRKCTLEDGERFLLRAIEIAPGWPLAYAELMKCLALMGRGREQEIPGVREMMKERCELEQLCLRYPTASDSLKESWNDSEALFP